MSTDLNKSTSTMKHSEELEGIKKKLESCGWQLESESRIHVAYSFDFLAWRKQQQEAKQSATDSNSTS